MSDWIRKVITKKLKPELASHGFHRYRSKRFVRIRGYLVEIISIDVSSSGFKGFYVNYFTNLACAPNWERIDTAYHIGDRAGYSEYDDIRWKGDTEENALLAMDSVLVTIEKDILPWFEERGTIQGYTIARAGHYSAHYKSIVLIMCLLLCGKLGKAYDMIKEIAESEEDVPDKSTFESLWEVMRHPDIDKLQAGIEVLNEMKHENLKRLGIDQYVT